MGKKSKKKKLLREIYAIIIFIIALIIAIKTPAIEIIDNTISNSIIANYANTLNSSNVIAVPNVKENKQIIESTSKNITIDKSKLNIIYFYVGQADATFVRNGDYSMLIDAGNNPDGKYISKYLRNKLGIKKIDYGITMLIDAGNSKDGEIIVNGLKALGIEKIDYLIGTHIHEDHIGGMSYVINSFDIGKIYLPYNESSTTNYYKKMLMAISNKGLSIEEANVGDKFKLKNAECEIMSVQNNEPENANLASIVIKLSYGKMKYLFMGDAETENEGLRDWEDIDVLKVGHHGSTTSSSTKFLSQVLPEISIISVGKNNSYNLPKDKIIERLKKIGSTIYRTDIDGTIQIISDGNQNEIKKIDLSFDGNS